MMGLQIRQVVLAVRPLVGVLAMVALGGCQAHRVGGVGGPLPDKWPDRIPVALLSTGVERWKACVGHDCVCTMPCKRSLDPTRPIVLQTRGDAVTVPNLFPAAREGSVALEIRSGRIDKAFGLPMIAVGAGAGGVGLIALPATIIVCAGLSNLGPDATACASWAAILGVTAALTSAAVWLVNETFPKLTVVPLRQYLADGGPVPPDYY